jgi:Flp pilus assembly protein TadB
MDRLQVMLLLTSLATATFLGIGTIVAAPFWDALALRWVRDFAPLVRSMSLGESRVLWGMRIWGASLVLLAAWMVLFLDAGILVIPVIYSVVMSPRWILDFAVHRRKRLIRDQVADVCTSLANVARSGQSMARALETVSGEAPRPISDELRRIVHDYRCGRPLREAIDDTRRRLALEPFSLMSVVLLSCLERGGRFTEELDNVVLSLRENQRLERKLNAETANGRTTLRLLTLFPVAFGGLMYLINPEGTVMLFLPGLGQFLVIGMAGLIYLSIVVARRILAIDI